MKRQLRIALRSWSVGAFVVPAAILLLHATGAQAITIPGTILPGAVSYEYFGFNSVDNIQTSSAVGTLNYTGGPGCGGTCIATTQLGSDPSASLNVNEVVFQNSGGGGAIAELGYYVEYVNQPNTTYTVNVHAPESLSIIEGASNAFAYFAFGVADGSPGTLNDFASYTLQEADCVNFGCQDIPVAGVTPAPFAADHSVQMVSDTPYFVLLDLQINPSTTATQSMAAIDPQFSTAATGGFFAYSPGVTDANATPEPGTLLLMASGFALLGGLRHRGRSK